MGLRKASCYAKIERPYTRKSKIKSKSYIKSVPYPRIQKFVMGNVKDFMQNKFPFVVYLKATEPVQIRDTALEASRVLIHRELEKKLKGSYYFAVSAYPHHVLRENKMLTGAGADRMQTGMQLSFGKPIGVAAQIDSNGKIFTVACFEDGLEIVKEALKKVKPKLPGKKTIVVEKRGEKEKKK